MELTTIQLHIDTKEKLESKKVHPRESYDSVVKRMLEDEDIPSMEEMFRRSDMIKESRKYSTKEVVEMVHRLRKK